MNGEVTIAAIIAAITALTTIEGQIWLRIQPKTRQMVDESAKEILKELEKTMREHSGACLALRQAEELRSESKMMDRMAAIQSEFRGDLQRVADSLENKLAAITERLDRVLDSRN